MMQAELSTKHHVVWKPIPGSSQELALDTRCHHTLFTGSRGPGKTDTQLMRFKRRVGLGYGMFWRGVIFDREYKNLDDLLSKSKRWFKAFNDGAEWLASTSSYKWIWPTGEELLFRSIKEDDDYDDYHGQEFPYIGWNELTKYPSPVLYNKMMSCNRSSFTPEKDSPIDPRTGKHFVWTDVEVDAHNSTTAREFWKKVGDPKLLPDIPLEVFATCNSYGAGHGWVKAKFIDPAPYGKVVRNTVHVFNPKTQQEEDVVRTQVAIFGSYKENIYLDAIYVAGLHEIDDDNLKASWIDGSWDVVAGGAFDDVWNRRIHVVPRFQVPLSWPIDRTFDWGSSQPFSVGWWAEANGEEVELDNGEVLAPAAGSLIQCGEWYGTKAVGTNKGLKMSAGSVALGIREREFQMLTDEWILSKPRPGPADNSIRDVREDDVDTIEKKMADKGIIWTSSDKSPGSRVNGLEVARERFKAAKKKEGPAIYIMDNCFATIATLPILPRDEVKADDVDTSAEDHVWDMVRYRVLKGNWRLATQLPVRWVN